MLILFHKELGRSFYHLLHLWCVQMMLSELKKKVATISLASKFKLFTNMAELFLLDALLFPFIVPSNCMLFSFAVMDECLLLVFDFLVALCWKFIVIYHASGSCISLQDNSSLAAQLQAKNI